MKTIAICIGKGGQAKTHTACSMSYLLAEAGHKTLVIDCDPQCNASLLFGAGVEGVNTLYDCWIEVRKPISPLECIQHTEKGDITTFSLRVYHIESVVTLVAAFLIGGTSTPFYLYQEGIFRMGGIGSGDADDGSTIVIGDDIGLAYLHDGDGGELQVIGGLSCIVGNGQGKTTSFADIAEAEGLIGNYLFPVNMYNGLGIRYADGGGIVIQTGGIGYNQ